MSEAKLMTLLFDSGMFNRDGKRTRMVFDREVSNCEETYRIWRKDGKPEIGYPRCDTDRYILYVDVNGYLVSLQRTEFQMVDECGYKPAIKELYGDEHARCTYFEHFRRIGCNIDVAMEREKEVIEKYGNAPERWAAHIKEILDQHVLLYKTCKSSGGMKHPDFVGACVLGELDECIKLSAIYREKTKIAEEKAAADRKERERKDREETNARAKEEVDAALGIIRNGGKLDNDRIEYYDKHGCCEEPMILHLMRRYGVRVPLRTQGWICQKLVSATVIDGRCDSLQYMRSKGATVSQKFFECMNELIRKVNEEEQK